MKYVIMCGGKYVKWGDKDKHLVKIQGEPLVSRTIRLLKANGVQDIAISSNSPVYEQFGVPVLKHSNNYTLNLEDSKGNWLDGFYPTSEPICYLFGDVVFSPEAINTIVKTKTDSIEFFASAPPFGKYYTKSWAEPFALKVVDNTLFFTSIERALKYEKEGLFYRQPVSWELWQLIKKTPINIIDYTNYTVINDYTCDIDDPDDVGKFKFLEVLP